MSESVNRTTPTTPGPEQVGAEQGWGPWGTRMGIGAQIYIGLACSVLLMVAASFVAYYYLNEIVRYQSRLATQSIPNLGRSVEIARRSTSLVSGAVRLVSVTSSHEHGNVAEEVMREQEALASLVEELAAGAALKDHAEMLEARLKTVGVLLREVYESSRQRLMVEPSIGLLIDELGEINRRLERNISTAIDNQGFFLVEGLRDIKDQKRPMAVRASESELAYYRDLIDANHQANLGGLSLGETLLVTDPDLLEPLRERFHSAVQNLVRSLDRLEGHIVNEVLRKDAERLIAIGESNRGIFALRRESLDRLAQERRLLAAGREASAALLHDMEELVAEVNREAVGVNVESQSAASTGILLLAVLNAVSLVGAFLIGWLFVGRHLVHRLVVLAATMRQMAGGDLEVPVAVSGKDEVTDMANALEVFRRHAIEVQRLNLVEKLAEELDGKNNALEQALAQLHKAQEQIVAEEKLASLGQLTAGVAHEIKNPLNFVNNFAEISVEMVDEIKEILKQAKQGEINDLAGEVNEVLADLRVNMTKVGEHGKRANDIVRSMLDHSRATPGDWRETDLNALLKQYVDLAYHAMRAEDRDFNITLTEDLDESIGLVEVVPQELCRAFLNILTNGCQAIDEKRRKVQGDYKPELHISSRRLDDGFVFSVRDNGTGIPEDLRQRMFEPFVTTKDAGRGTGLGLSLTVDIVVRHGGSIEVDSEEGAYTEMRILLPLDPAANRESSADEPD